MIVHCVVCGKAIERKNPRRKNFCSAEHRNLWMSENVDIRRLTSRISIASVIHTAISPIVAKPTQRRRVPQQRCTSVDRWSMVK